MTPPSEYDGLEDADEFGFDHPEVTDLPSPRLVLSQVKEVMPNWLRECEGLDCTVATGFLSSRTVFYPGAGLDGHAIEVFGSTHSAHCFIHVDYGVGGTTSSQVLDVLQQDDPYRCKGYYPTQIVEMTADELQDLFGLRMTHPVPGRNAKLKDGLWTILQRDSGLDADHGPERLAFLHIHAEAVWLYWNLCQSAHRAFAVVLQDHGFGGKWTDFGGADSYLFQCAERNGLLPEWLLVAINTDCWPGYNAASDWEQTIPGTGMHVTKRRLAKRTNCP